MTLSRISLSFTRQTRSRLPHKTNQIMDKTYSSPDDGDGHFALSFLTRKSFTPERNFAGVNSDLPCVCIEGIRADSSLPGFRLAGGGMKGLLHSYRSVGIGDSAQPSLAMLWKGTRNTTRLHMYVQISFLTILRPRSGELPANPVSHYLRHRQQGNG